MAHVDDIERKGVRHRCDREMVCFAKCEIRLKMGAIG